MTVPLRVAVMGCVVNGPGEAREADLGVASGNGKGQIFVKGEVIKTVPESRRSSRRSRKPSRSPSPCVADTAPV
jgi:4-hydroxy-3-methylbut-2-en-1-yl diphosphate synthase IspG/GcpE